MVSTVAVFGGVIIIEKKKIPLITFRYIQTYKITEFSFDYIRVKILVIKEYLFLYEIKNIHS